MDTSKLSADASLKCIGVGCQEMTSINTIILHLNEEKKNCLLSETLMLRRNQAQSKAVVPTEEPSRPSQPVVLTTQQHVRNIQELLNKTCPHCRRVFPDFDGCLAVHCDGPHGCQEHFCGACFICRRELFFELGGFDEIYTPYAWEDLDLAYRAWKRGYKVIYEPMAVCYHKREATTRNLFSNFSRVNL